MTKYKKYRNKNTGEIVEAQLRSDGGYNVIDPNCPVHQMMKRVNFAVDAANFLKYFEEVKSE